MRINILLTIICAASLLFGQQSNNYFDVKKVISQQKELFNSSDFGFVDLHNSALSRIFMTGDPASIEDTGFFVNSRWIKESGLRLIFLSIGIPRFSMQNEDTVTIQHVLSFMKSFKKYISENHSEFVFVNDEVEATEEIDNGKICFVYALEGMNLIEGNLNWIDSLYEVGVRMIGIGHTFTDQIVINSDDIPGPSFVNDSSVISEFGKEAINKLIDNGILVDLSHLGQKAFEQAVQIINNRQPLLISHTASKSVCNHFRNISDEQVQSVNDSNGIIGLIFHSTYLNKNTTAELNDYKKHFEYLKSKMDKSLILIGSDLEGNIIPFENYEKVFIKK